MKRERNYAGWLIAAAISAYFVWLASQAIGAHFAQDDPMNLGFYWERGFWPSFWDDLRFWSTAYRPMGAMFYLPIYHLFGLNPLPYRIAVFALIAVNTVLSYRIADLLTGSRAAAMLTAVLVCAHGNMGSIYFNTSQIYDILAYFFLAIMLLCYIQFRRRGELTIGQSAVVICAYIAALDAKEIAVVGAGWILAYELLFHRSWKFSAQAIGAFVRERTLRVPLLMVLIALVFAAGKSYGPAALSKQSGYVLETTWHRYFFNNYTYLNDLFYTHFFSTSRLLIFFGALTLLCAIARRRELWWAWFVISTVTLPLSFTVRPRGGSGLYVPLLGWAILIGVVAVILAKRVELQWVVCALLAVLSAWYTLWSWQFIKPAALDDHQLTWSTITQISDLPSKPPHHSRVIFLEHPYPDWNTYFMAELLWNDPTVQINLFDKMTPPPSDADLAKFDWVLTFDGAKLRVVRAR